jgi:hypothetical protein
MVQKQKDRNKSVTDSISDTMSGSNSASTGSRSSSMSGRLLDAIRSESSTVGILRSGAVTLLAGGILSGILPTFIIPLVIGYAIGGAVLGKIGSDNVFSLIAGVSITSFLVLWLTISLPFGLGIFAALGLSVLTTGATTAAHQYVSDTDY